MSPDNVEQILSELTLQEKISLLGGIDFWHTKAIPRLGVPSIRLTDGPNGARGTQFFNGLPAACFPCGTGLGATWDTELLFTTGQAMAAEALIKGAFVLLGPTVNIQRSPLGGRGFESFAEDPLLSGALASAVIKGLQSKGVAATLKHFVCNDQEHERMAVSAVVSDRALREIYLMPFQIAQRDAEPMAIMTSYNKVNGLHCSESPKLIGNILRKEWGFDGLVMSDWYGTYSSSPALQAGLDLEMPGPPKCRGMQLSIALNSGKLTEETINESARRVLRFVAQVSQTKSKEGQDGNTKETADLLRHISSSSIVLLKNERSVLPFNPMKRVAVIGPNAKIATFCGGGSAALPPYYAITPFDGIKTQAKDVSYALGAYTHKYLPLLGQLLRTVDGKEGFVLKFYAEPPNSSSRTVVDELQLTDSNIFLADYKNPKLPGSLYYVDLEATFTPEEDGEYSFGLSVSGTAKAFIDGSLVVDNATKQRSGDIFFGTGTVEETGTMQMHARKTYKILVQFGTSPTATYARPAGVAPLGVGGFRVGGARNINPEAEIERAAKLAGEVDQVIVCAGLNSEWESEGYDRENMDLPGHVNALVAAVCAANPNTAVVIQSGTPVGMPWLADAPAVLQAWYGGNETGNAIADVLFGATNPSAKLPLTFPIKNEDNPAFLNFRSECGRTIYGEDIYVGYRFYDKLRREVLFSFGHGLSYTTFEMFGLEISDTGEEVEVAVQVKNTGKVDGAQVVQVYVSHAKPAISRPPVELKGFTKVFLKAGELKKATVKMLKRYMTSYWNEVREMWVMEKGSYSVWVGDNVQDKRLRKSFEVEETKYWKGL